MGNNPIRYTDPKGLNPAAGALGGFAVGGPAGAIVGGLIGGLAGAAATDYVYNHWWDDEEEDDIVPLPKPKPQPKPQPKPKNCPTGTKPIDEMGWPRDKVHKVKDGLGLGATDWTGVAPDGSIIVTGPDGNAEEAGHESNF